MIHNVCICRTEDDMSTMWSFRKILSLCKTQTKLSEWNVPLQLRIRQSASGLLVGLPGMVVKTMEDSV